MIGGNVIAHVTRVTSSKNKLGVSEKGAPSFVMELPGFIDYVNGQQNNGYKSMVEESTHIFVSDYDESYAALSEKGLSLIVGDREYDVLLIDDPMGLHYHIETYLQYVGVV